MFLIRFDAVFCSSISHSSYQIIQPYEYVFQQLHSINFLSAIDFLVRHKKILSTNFFSSFYLPGSFWKEIFFSIKQTCSKDLEFYQIKKRCAESDEDHAANDIGIDIKINWHQYQHRYFNLLEQTCYSQTFMEMQSRLMGWIQKIQGWR